MQTLKKIYYSAGLEIPKKNEKGEYEAVKPDNFKNIKIGSEKFLINWDIIDKIIENYSNENEDSNQIEEFFSDEKMIEEDIIYSSKIEGINIQKEDLKKEETEEKEIKLDYKKSYSLAYDYLFSNDYISHEVLEEIKQILAKSELIEISDMAPKGKRYRNDSVSIFKNSNGVDKKIHDGIHHEKIEKAMDELFGYYNGYNYDKDFAPTVAIRAAISHCLFEFIHPYFDGNGRIGRMLMNWSIRKTPFYQSSYFLANIIENNKNKYYLSLEHSQKTRDLAYHSAFLFAAMEESMQVYGELVMVMNKIRLSNTQLEFLKKLLIYGMITNEVSYPDVKSKFAGQSKQSFYKMIDKLVGLGVLKKRETAKTNYYSLNR